MLFASLILYRTLDYVSLLFQHCAGSQDRPKLVRPHLLGMYRIVNFTIQPVPDSKCTIRLEPELDSTIRL